MKCLNFRSDDTARSEVESRGDPDVGEDNTSSVSCKYLATYVCINT